MRSLVVLVAVLLAPAALAAAGDPVTVPLHIAVDAEGLFLHDEDEPAVRQLARAFYPEQNVTLVVHNDDAREHTFWVREEPTVCAPAEAAAPTFQPREVAIPAGANATLQFDFPPQPEGASAPRLLVGVDDASRGHLTTYDGLYGHSVQCKRPAPVPGAAVPALLVGILALALVRRR